MDDSSNGYIWQSTLLQVNGRSVNSIERILALKLLIFATIHNVLKPIFPRSATYIVCLRHCLERYNYDIVSKRHYEGGHTTKKILIIDDEKNAVELMEICLRDEGFEALTARTNKRQ